MVNGGEPITDGGTRQGIWIGTAGGTLLASINSQSADAVLATLERGWAAWESLPDEVKRLPEGAELAPAHRWEMSRPGGGLVLERFARDVQPDPAMEPLRPWNRDYAWFTRAEARAWLPADPRPGDVHPVPEVSAHRLARFHLTDNVRGQTLPYAEEEVDRAELRVEVLARSGARVELRISGRTRTEALGPWLLGENLWKPARDQPPHGITAELLGRATYDLDEEAFVAFDLVALGERWGHTAMNGRARDPEPGRIGFCFALAPPEPVIAPTFIALYDADWVDFAGSEVENY